MEIEHITPTKFQNLAPLFDAARTTNLKKVVRAHFASMSEFVDATPEQCPSNPIERGPWETSSNQNEWSGCTVADAWRFGREGWPEGAERANAARASIQANMPQANRMRAYSTAGAVPNVARFLSGNPLNMHTQKRTDSTRQPVLTFLVPMCANSHVDAKKFEMQAACAAALVDMLEDRGFRCEVYAYDMATRSYASDTAAEMMVKVKDAGSPVNLQTLAFACGHPGMGRRLALAYPSATPAFRFLGVGLGSPMAIKANPQTGVFTLPDIARYNLRMDAAKNFTDVVLKHARNEGCPGVELEV